MDRIAGLGLSTDAIQRDDVYPTGTVEVVLGQDGQPEFTINGDVAWEHMAWTPGWTALAAQTDAVCFGTVCRHMAGSATAVTAFLEALVPSALRLFDVNLRQDRYSPALLNDSFHHAHIAKLNDEELRTVCPLLDLGGKDLGGDDLESMARQLRERYELEVVCVTRGAEGSLLVTASETVAHPGVPVDVVDTIGAGDAFTAVLASGYLRGVPLERVSEAANRLGAWVAAQTGAMPAADEAVCSAIRNILREA